MDFMLRYLVRLSLTLLILFASPSFAAPIIDQNNPTVHESYYCQFSTDIWCGQSFQQDHPNISGAGIFLMPDTFYFASAPKRITLSIYTSYGPSGPSGLLASGTSGLLAEDNIWVDVFWSPVSITPSTTYYLIADNGPYDFDTPYWGMAFSSADYPKGDAVYGGRNLRPEDATFRTYFDNAVSAVPEPGSLALLGAALGAFGLSRRRKKA